MPLTVAANNTALFLSNLFSRLNEEKITYCVLRNYEDLPEKIGNDIDIWIEAGNQDAFRNILQGVAKSFNWEVIKYKITYSPRLNSDGEGEYFVVKNNSEINIIPIDCWTIPYWKGLPYINYAIISKNIILHPKGFYVPSSGLEASILLLNKLLYYGKVADKYKNRIKKLAKEDQYGFLSAIEKPFGKKCAECILHLVGEARWDELDKNCSLIRRELLKRTLLREPYQQLKRWSIYFYGHFKKYLHADIGIFIVLIGPDGSGKTTISNLLMDSSIKKFFQKKYYFHGHFPYLPELKNILAVMTGRKRFKDVYENQAVNEKFQNIKPFNTLRAMIYPLYYGMNYFLGHIFIRKEKAVASFIIFDRYFYDYFLQIPYLNCPRWLLYAITKIIPKPDAIIYLKNEAKIIHARKPELPVEEIERQAEICQKMVKRFKNTFVVETFHSPEKTVKKIQEIIINKIKESQK